MKRTFLGSCLLIGLLTATSVCAGDLYFTVGLGYCSGALIHADVLENGNAPNSGQTVLFVHGLAHGGNSFRPLVQEISTNPLTKNRIRRAVLLNMPGRGGSFVTGMEFGELTLADYAKILRATLDECKDEHIAPSTIVAHSMGNLVVLLADQQIFTESGGTKSLKSKYSSVTKVRSLGGSSSGDVDDPVLEVGTGLYLLSLYARDLPLLGQTVIVPPNSNDPAIPDFIDLFFTNLSGVVVPNAPTPAQLVLKGYESIEAYGAALNTVGTKDMRPGTRSGAFAPSGGVSYKALFGAEDAFSSFDQQAAMYQYVTGDASNSGVIVIPGADSVHDQFITNPSAVLSFLDL